MRKKVSVAIILIATLTIGLVNTSGTFAKGKTPLAKPSISTTVLSLESMNISWKKVKNAKQYVVEIKHGQKAIAKRYTTATTYKLKKLKKGYVYQIKVTAMPSSSSFEKAENRRSVTMPKKITRSMKGFGKTNAGKLLKLANGKIGCKYVSGGSGPRVFDCSGYVYYITKCANKAGYTSGKLKRASDAGELSQMKRMKGAKYVGRRYSKAQPGDIVFMGGHVAFYYGNDKLIHATNPRKGVAITSTKWSGGEKRIVAIYRLPEM